jgi:uncharacterized membrane protein YbhN (UPF0104 family)
VSKYLRIAVSALLLSVIAWRTDFHVVAGRFANLNVGLWLAAVGTLVVAMLASAKRWELFARQLRFERNLLQYCAYYFIGMWFNLSLPTSVGGDVVRVWYLDGKSGRKLAAFASVFLERLNGLLVLIALACVGVLISPIRLEWWISACVWGVAGCAFVGVVSLPIAQRWQGLPLQRRAQLRIMLDLSRIPRVMAGATLMSILVQLCGVVCLWLIGLALGLEVPAAYYCILGPMVSLLTLLPISVNGMGVREQSTIVFLAPLQVDAESAATLAFLWFAVSVAISLLGGAIYLFGAYPKAHASTSAAKEDPRDRPVDRDSDQGREGQPSKAA